MKQLTEEILTMNFYFNSPSILIPQKVPPFSKTLINGPAKSKKKGIAVEST
ncbi:MAG: hypothetical protein GXC73_20065 [Chitinophagaceae bacterium]|nr:hypothetical protein [Chitinophagaceae bacterium]